MRSVAAVGIFGCVQSTLSLLVSGRIHFMICDLQKASLWKRISAFLFDIIMLFVVAVGMALVVSVVIGYDKQMDKAKAYQTEYESKYGIDINISTEDYNNLSEDERVKYDEAEEAFSNDGRVLKVYDMMFNMSLIIVTLGFLLAYLILEWIVPFIFKDGRTLGKKFFGLGVIRTNSVRAKPSVLFVRMLLGKFTIETMVPVYLLVMMFFGVLNVAIGLFVVLGILILQIVVMCATKTNSAIHDLLSDTVVVDMSTQMVFESEEAMIEYKKRIHAEEASRAKY